MKTKITTLFALTPLLLTGCFSHTNKQHAHDHTIVKGANTVVGTMETSGDNKGSFIVNVGDYNYHPIINDSSNKPDKPSPDKEALDSLKNAKDSIEYKSALNTLSDRFKNSINTGSHVYDPFSNEPSYIDGFGLGLVTMDGYEIFEGDIEGFKGIEIKSIYDSESVSENGVLKPSGDLYATLINKNNNEYKKIHISVDDLNDMNNLNSMYYDNNITKNDTSEIDVLSREFMLLNYWYLYKFESNFPLEKISDKSVKSKYKWIDKIIKYHNEIDDNGTIDCGSYGKMSKNTTFIPLLVNNDENIYTRPSIEEKKYLEAIKNKQDMNNFLKDLECVSASMYLTISLPSAGYQFLQMIDMTPNKYEIIDNIKANDDILNINLISIFSGLELYTSMLNATDGNVSATKLYYKDKNEDKTIYPSVSYDVAISLNGKDKDYFRIQAIDGIGIIMMERLYIDDAEFHNRTPLQINNKTNKKPWEIRGDIINDNRAQVYKIMFTSKYMDDASEIIEPYSHHSY